MLRVKRRKYDAQIEAVVEWRGLPLSDHPLALSRVKDEVADRWKSGAFAAEQGEFWFQPRLSRPTV